MTEYPEKTCAIERLVTHDKLVEAALEGRKTQQRRAGVYAYPGETFVLKGKTFVVKDLRQETLNDMTDIEAQKEGYPNMEFYKDLILRMHKGMEWDPNEKVWVHEFEIADSE
ncbi:MAG: ASCH domain-containing protein [Planctomycetota bacterium]